jgi:putative FmdB family regulatory protein
MPIYECDCGACGARFEKLVFLTAQPKPMNCPECESARVSKRLSLIASASASDAESTASSAACTTST